MSEERTSRDLGEMLVKAESGVTKQVDITKVGRGAFNTKGSSWLNPVVRDFITLEYSARNNETVDGGARDGASVALIVSIFSFILIYQGWIEFELLLSLILICSLCGLLVLSKKTKRFPLRAVDPYAGQGDMLKLCESEFGMETSGYDIQDDLGWEVNDSLESIPRSVGAICITNPPYLANYSAKRKSMWPMVGQYYEDSGRSDLYEIALDKCLESFDHVVAIIPETFLHSTYPKERCQRIVILEENPFEDTTFPVCVTCWVPEKGQDPTIYVAEKEIMRFSEMVGIKGDVTRSNRIVFNDPDGNVGLKAVDGTKPDDRIRFVPGEEFDYPRSSIKVSSRLMTYLDIPELESEEEISEFCRRANEIFEGYRERSEDIILSGFKGNNKEGKRRRRLDYRLARKVILEALR